MNAILEWLLAWIIQLTLQEEAEWQQERYTRQELHSPQEQELKNLFPKQHIPSLFSILVTNQIP